MSNPSFTPDPNFCIRTERLCISHFIPSNPDHSAALAKIWNITPEQAQTNLEGRIPTHHTRYGYGQYLVSLKPRPDAPLAECTPIGTVSLMRGEGYTAPDIGYSIIEEQRGKGYATEAAKALLAYAPNLGADAVFGFCAWDNKRSIRVLEKIGLESRGERNLRAFGNHRSAVWVQPGMDQDLKVYGVDD